MPNNDYANEPNQSRSEEIIQSILDNTEYDEAARSRIEYLLIELKNAIEGGGGGGGVTSYSPLTEKPKIDNHTLQPGNNTSSDLGLQTKLTFDSTPTESSTNPVTSGGVYTALGTKANSADVYNKSAVDTALSAKADKSTTYTKTEVDTALSSKQNTISDLSTIRSGAALGATAVQPVSGKGLSTNDYTTAEKEKLAGIEAKANKTTVDSALSDSSTNPVQNKVVKLALDGKQNTLTTAQLAAINSGIDSADVEQIETNKNNISYLENTGKKNWLKPDTITGVPTGITIQYESDDSITINGTYSGSDYAYVFLHSFSYTAMRYTLSCNVETKASTFYFYTRDNKMSTTSTLIYTYSDSGTTKIVMRIAPNTSFSNVNVKLMIRPSIITDTSYQPYALSNAELTSGVLYNTNNGVANLCPINAGTTTGAQFVFDWQAINNVAAGDYTFSFECTATTGAIAIELGDSNHARTGYVTVALPAKSADFTVISGTRYIRVYTNVANTVSKIRLIPKSLANTPYQPYALSNVELTEGKADIAATVTKGEKYVENEEKTYTLKRDTAHLLTVVSYNYAGFFIALKYTAETTPRLFPVYKSTNFDNNLTVAPVANSAKISINPLNSSTWYISNIAVM